MIALGSDHGGYALKEALKRRLEARGAAYTDYGTHSADSCDYPDCVLPVCRAVAGGEAERGILICSTGVGVSIAANKAPGIRAALCGDCYSAKYTRLHNDANILCLGALVTGTGLALEIVDLFLSVPFEGGRHQRRLDKITAIEEENRGMPG